MDSWHFVLTCRDMGGGAESCSGVGPEERLTMIDVVGLGLGDERKENCSSAKYKDLRLVKVHWNETDTMQTSPISQAEQACYRIANALRPLCNPKTIHASPTTDF